MEQIAAKPPQVRSLPDILTLEEVALLINSARELRYRVYILTTYSMGLRLGEALNLKVGDIDSTLIDSLQLRLAEDKS